MLASHPGIKAVFVVGCTTNSRDERDFSKLLDVRGVLMNEVFCYPASPGDSRAYHRSQGL